MSRAAFFAITASGVLGWATVAAAVPTLDAPAGRPTLTIGVPAASFDLALTDHLTLGATAGYYLLVPFHAAGRAVVRIWGAPGEPSLAAMVSCGRSTLTFLGTNDYTWLQPALLLSFPFGATGVTLRASAGPAFYSLYNHDDLVITPHAIPYNPKPKTTSGVFAIVPGIELGIKLGAAGELVLGGDAILGWRHTF